MYPQAGFELLKDNLWNAYLKSPVGILVAIVPPAGLAVFFTAPQGLYVWYNTAAWLLLATLVFTTANVLAGNRTVFERYPVPIHSFLYFPVLRALLNYSIAYGVLVGFLCKAGYPPAAANLVLGWILILPLAALGFALGLIFSVANALYRWKAGLLLPVFCLLILWEIHPLSSLITFPSKAFLDGDLSGARAYVLSAASSLLFLAFSLRFFWTAKKRLFEKCL